MSDRELDSQVAERVMGLVPCAAWKKVNFGRSGGPALMGTGCDHNGNCYPTVEISGGIGGGSIGGVPRYSSSIEAAMEVVEKMRNSGEWCCIELKSDYHYIWRVALTPAEKHESDPHEPTVTVQDESLPKAICLAAIKSTM